MEMGYRAATRGVWYFYDSVGAYGAFLMQNRVRPLNDPQPTRRGTRQFQVV